VTGTQPLGHHAGCTFARAGTPAGPGPDVSPPLPRSPGLIPGVGGEYPATWPGMSKVKPERIRQNDLQGQAVDQYSRSLIRRPSIPPLERGFFQEVRRPMSLISSRLPKKR